ncbi:alpha/beta hydrolase [bacterium]|nr:alpha/beta hydrolase [bacterium]MDB4380201.1 alpha/beta hydrolase [Mariniblastus sp.]MDA7904341.1 alpha/beta hydrolase [bacterium]MDB4374412.1 alpha/beta hydrolase [bacterium]MDB4564786.1 alpha/beta hydrolase [Mariniblastus sp.]
MIKKTLSVRDALLHVVDEGQGPPLLLIHGFPLNQRMWEFQILEFAKTHRVICPDLAGFGLSQCGEPRLDLRSHAEDISDILDALNVRERVVFCGLSMGGYIGWEFWKKYPEKISKIIACNTRAASDSLEVARGRRIAAKSIFKTGTQILAKQMAPRLLYSNPQERIKTIQLSVEQMIESTSPDSIAAGQLAMSNRSDATAWLPMIDCPTLFVGGQYDEITTTQEMSSNAALICNAQFVEIKTAGHLTPLEQPDSFNHQVLEFLNSNR